MRHILAVQTAASLIVLAVVAMAELAALLLAHFPSSAFVWYLNQEVFRFMENARDSLTSPVHLLLNQTTLYWDVGLALVVLLVHRVRWRFGAALISHACLMFSGFLIFDWAVAMKLSKTASLTPVIAAFGQANGTVLLLAGGAALLSAGLAHFTYLAGSSSIWLAQTRDRNTHPRRIGGNSDICDLRRSSKLPGPE